MARLFIICITKNTNEVEMKVLSTEQAVIEYIVKINGEKDPRSVDKIFSVTNTGKVNYYDIEFKGRFVLIELPEVRPFDF